MNSQWKTLECQQDSNDTALKTSLLFNFNSNDTLLKSSYQTVNIEFTSLSQSLMERRVQGNLLARCGAGENSTSQFRSADLF